MGPSTTQREIRKMTQEELNLISAFKQFPEYSYKKIALVMGITPVQVAILRNNANRKGAELLSRHISD